MKITRGKIATALKIVAYGPEGIGKSTFASQFPGAVFIDTEGSTKTMDVARTPTPLSFTQLLQQIQYFVNHPNEAQTVVIDTADWAERLCKAELCDSRQWKGIEDAGYGKGYTYLAELMGNMLNMLSALTDVGVNVVLTAHAMMRKFEQPDEMGAYDRWELKLEKKVAPLVKEWADLLLFANYKTMVVNVDDKGAAKGKNKVQGGRRVMYASHHPCWDAKNRFGLPDEMPFEFSSIAHILPAKTPTYTPEPAPIAPAPVQQTAMPKPAPESAPEPPEQQNLFDEPVPFDNLRALMEQSGVTCQEVRWAVAQAGYYPEATPIATYDATFVSGELLPNWAVVVSMIQAERDDTPF